MSDRLLSDEEIISCRKSEKADHLGLRAIAKAQRNLTAAVVNAEWVKWIENAANKRFDGRGFYISITKLQERKRGVGL